jgi:hypothetical protein
MQTQTAKLTRRVKICIVIVIAGLFISGITAFPLESELTWLVKHQSLPNGQMTTWLSKVYSAIVSANQSYPFLSYGTDWLAFAHVMLAVLFIGPYIDPVKNKWVIQFGIIAAVAIFPLAFIAGSIRGIPFFWQLIDCSFGVITLALLIPCHRYIVKLEKLS